MSFESVAVGNRVSRWLLKDCQSKKSSAILGRRTGWVESNGLWTIGLLVIGLSEAAMMICDGGQYSGDWIEVHGGKWEEG